MTRRQNAHSKLSSACLLGTPYCYTVFGTIRHHPTFDHECGGIRQACHQMFDLASLFGSLFLTMVVVKLSLGVIVLGWWKFLPNLKPDRYHEKPRGSRSLQSRWPRMLHYECDTLWKAIVFWGALSFFNCSVLRDQNNTPPCPRSCLHSLQIHPSGNSACCLHLIQFFL